MPGQLTTTLLAIHDALALRGLEKTDAGFMRSAKPEDYMNERRLQLARALLDHLPVNATTADATRLVDRMQPIVARTLENLAADDQGEDGITGVRILS